MRSMSTSDAKPSVMPWGTLRLDSYETPVYGQKAVFEQLNVIDESTQKTSARRDEMSLLLAQDLVAILMGGEGTFVKKQQHGVVSWQGARFKASGNRLDTVLEYTIKPVLHLATCMDALRATISSYSSLSLGRVYQAMAGELNLIAGEFDEILAAISVALADPNGNFELSDMLEHLAEAGVPILHAYDAIQMLQTAAAKPADQLPVPSDYRGSDGTLEYLVALQKRRGPAVSGDLAGLINESVITAQKTSSRPSSAVSSMSIDEQPLLAWSTEQVPIPCLRGGSALGLLSDHYQTHYGSNHARAVLSRLFNAASKPYLAMLSAWLFCGQIDDPFNEFVVREAKDMIQELRNTPFADDYWAQRYRLWGPNLLPSALADPLIASQLLAAGKHLNVLSGDLTNNIFKDLQAEFQNLESLLDPQLPYFISKAYDIASSALLTQFRSHYDLQGYLIACQRIFFWSDTDFCSMFLDLAASELSRPLGEASVSRLQYWLDMAIAQPGSASIQQPKLDETKVSLANTSLTDELVLIANAAGIRSRDLKKHKDSGGGQLRMAGVAPPRASKPGLNEAGGELTALDAIQFDLEIPFPLSLIITRSSLYRYQFVSRHLLSLKVAISALTDAWTVQTSVLDGSHFSHQWQLGALGLRAKISLGLSTIYKFCAFCVIEDSWIDFCAEQDHVESVEALAALHLAFLDQCTKRCMLTTEPLLLARAKVIRVARRYAQFLVSAEDALMWLDPLADHEKLGDPPVGEDGQQFSNEELQGWLESSLQYYEQSWKRNFANYYSKLQKEAQKSPSLQLLAADLGSIN